MVFLMGIFSGSFAAIERSLAYSSLKHDLIAQNIANADTPNYKGRQISFKNTLNDAVSAFEPKTTDTRHIRMKTRDGFQVSFSNRPVQYNHNGNNVDIDKEMSDLAANQIYYSAMTDRLNGKLSTLQTVIKGGK